MKISQYVWCLKKQVPSKSLTFPGLVTYLLAPLKYNESLGFLTSQNRLSYVVLIKSKIPIVKHNQTFLPGPATSLRWLSVSVYSLCPF